MITLFRFCQEMDGEQSPLLFLKGSCMVFGRRGDQQLNNHAFRQMNHHLTDEPIFLLTINDLNCYYIESLCNHFS